jgi:hypothetical protein
MTYKGQAFANSLQGFVWSLLRDLRQGFKLLARSHGFAIWPTWSVIVRYLSVSFCFSWSALQFTR